MSVAAMKRAVIAFAALLALGAPAFDQTTALPQGEIRANGDITFGNALKLGKREGNKTVITPDVLEVLVPGNTADSYTATAAKTKLSRRNYTKFDNDETGVDVQFGPNEEITARLGGLPQFDAIRSMVTNSGPSNAVGQVSAVAGTVRGRVQNKTPGNNGYSVGGFFNASCEVNNCVSWGINPVVSDWGPDPNSSTPRPWLNEPGVFGRVIEGAEIDVNVVNTSTIAKGVNLIGNFLTGTTVTPTFGYLLDVNQFSPAWAQGYTTGRGAARIALSIGQMAKSGTNVGSQPINFRYFDGAGADKAATLDLKAGTANGNILTISGDADGFKSPNFFLPSGGQIQFANSGAGGAPLQAMFIDSNNSLNFAASANEVFIHTNMNPRSNAGANLGTAELAYNEINAVTLYTVPRTFAQLPGSPRNGMRAIITDANSCAFYGAVAGGGSMICPVFYANGWKAGG
jgi:hypothetical protein